MEKKLRKHIIAYGLHELVCSSEAIKATYSKNTSLSVQNIIFYNIVLKISQAFKNGINMRNKSKYFLIVFILKDLIDVKINVF